MGEFNFFISHVYKYIAGELTVIILFLFGNFIILTICFVMDVHIDDFVYGIMNDIANPGKPLFVVFAVQNHDKIRTCYPHSFLHRTLVY